MPERSGQDFLAGYLKAQYEALRLDIANVHESLGEHRDEEREVWQRFEDKLKELESKLNAVERWRARVSGIAVGVSIAVNVAWDAVVSFIRRGATP